jgi:hypothetical protein
VIALLEFMLVRDPQHRPSLKAVKQRFNMLFERVLQQVPREKPAAGGVRPTEDPAETTERAEALARMELITKPSKLTQPFVTHCTAAAHEITEGLYIGRAQFAGEAKLRITHVAVCGEMRQIELGHHLERIQVSPSQGTVGEMLHKSCEFIRGAIQGGGKVLLCCDQGLCWSPAVAIAYVMQERKVGVFEAYLLVRENYFALRPNAGVFTALFEWEEACKGRTVTVA